jgi:hypothetical protein
MSKEEERIHALRCNAICRMTPWYDSLPEDQQYIVQAIATAVGSLMVTMFADGDRRPGDETGDEAFENIVHHRFKEAPRQGS